MSRRYWSDPHPARLPAWARCVVLTLAASVGFAVARVAWHLNGRR